MKKSLFLLIFLIIGLPLAERTKELCPFYEVSWSPLLNSGAKKGGQYLLSHFFGESRLFSAMAGTTPLGPVSPAP
jgi:hypothetical protein